MSLMTILNKKLFRSTSIVAFMTMLSRLLGFARDVILAQIFGAGPGFDAFVVAFKIPNFLRRLFGEGAFSQAFVPVLAEYKEKKTPEEMQAFIDGIAGQLGAATLLVVLLAEIFTPILVLVFAPGFVNDPHRLHIAQHMLHLTFPYLFFIALTAFAGACLNTMGNFAVPALTPILLNVSMIIAALWFSPHTKMPIYALGWGVILAGVAQLAIQIPFLSKVGMLARPRLNWKNQGVQRVLKLMVPALFGVSVAQISLMIDNFFGSFLPAGSISWLYYSDRLTYLPLGVFGVALATVVLPQLSRQHAKGTTEQFSVTIDWSIRCVLLIGVPAAIGLFALAGPLLATLIHRGQFGVRDVYMTERSLMAFSVGLPGFMLIKVLASAFYSRQNIKTPVKIAAVALLINLALNLALIKPLAHAGLALATSLASLCNAGMLLALLVREAVYVPAAGWGKFVLRGAIGSGAMLALLWYFSAPLATWLAWTGWQRVWHLFALIFAAIIIYFLGLYISGMRTSDFNPPADAL